MALAIQHNLDAGVDSVAGLWVWLRPIQGKVERSDFPRIGYEISSLDCSDLKGRRPLQGGFGPYNDRRMTKDGHIARDIGACVDDLIMIRVLE